MSAKEEKRARILEGAIEVIARFGLQKTTMEDIAQRARLKPASVYYYFKSKEDVLAAVVRHQADEVHARIRTAIDAADTPEAKLVAFLFARFSYIDILARLGEWEQNAAHDAYPMIEQVVKDYRDRANDLLLEVLVLGKERGDFDIDDPKKLAHGMLAVMRAMDTLLVSNTLDLSTKEGLKALLSIYLKGLKTK